MKHSLMIVLLTLSSIGAVVAAPASSDVMPAGSARTGSRAQRPDVKDPLLSSPTTEFAQPGHGSSLKAEQLTAVQGVGRAVLAAKHSVQPDPAATAMHQELKAISTELVQVFSQGSISKPTLTKGSRKISQAAKTASDAAFTADLLPSNRLVPGRAPNTFIEDTVAPSPDPTRASRSAPVVPERVAAKEAAPPVPVKNAGAWQHDVASLQQRLATTRAKAPLVSVAADAGASMHPHLAHLAEKETALLAEIQSAVDSEDATQLAALRERLMSRRLPEERERLRALADPEHTLRPVPTPTVSTLTKHR